MASEDDPPAANVSPSDWMQRVQAVEPRTLRTRRLVLNPQHRAAERGVAGPAQAWGVRPLWAISSGADSVGTIQLTVDGGNQIAELGYSVESAHRNQGIASEAARATIDWGFSALSLAKIYARTDAWNEASWHVMNNAGLRREAVLRSHHAYRGGRTDEVWYGISRAEWTDAGGLVERPQDS